MSDERLFVSRGENCLEVSLRGVVMPINELRIRPMSNFSTPHELLGRGGTRMSLTNKQLMEVVAEYMRYSISESTEVEHKQVGYDFHCSVRANY